MPGITTAVSSLFNLSKDIITVGYIDPIRGYVKGVTVCEANEYAELNPGTTFIFIDGDGNTRYLRIKQVNELTAKDLLKTEECDPDFGKCGPPKIQIFGGGGVGARANPIISQTSGAIIAADLVFGGHGYAVEPFAQAIDPCNQGAGAVFETRVGIITTTDEVFDKEDDIEVYYKCPDLGVNPRDYGPEGEDRGEWNPDKYFDTNKDTDPIQQEIEKYQKFLKTYANPWWHSRLKSPKKITGNGKAYSKVYNVTHVGTGYTTQVIMKSVPVEPGPAIVQIEPPKPPSLTQEVEFSLYRSVGANPANNFEDGRGTIKFTFTPIKGEGQPFSFINDDIPHQKYVKKKITVYKNTVYKIEASITEKGLKLKPNGLVEQGTLDSKYANASVVNNLTMRGLSSNNLSRRNIKEFNQKSQVIFADILPTANDNNDFVISIPTGQGNFTPGKKTEISVANQKRNTYELEYVLEVKEESKQTQSTINNQNLPVVKASFVKKDDGIYLDATGYSGQIELDFKFLVSDSKEGKGWAGLEFEIPGTPIKYTRQLDKKGITPISRENITKKYTIQGGKLYGPVKFPGITSGGTFVLESDRTIAALDPQSASEYNKKKSTKGVERDFDVYIQAARALPGVLISETTPSGSRSVVAGVTTETFKTKTWNDFMNTYAVSPVPDSNLPGSDYANTLFTIEWEENFPYPGEYIFRGCRDNVSQLYIDNKFISDLQNFNQDPVPVPVQMTEGNHTIRVDLLNLPVMEKKVEQVLEGESVNTPKVVETQVQTPTSTTVDEWVRVADEFTEPVRQLRDRGGIGPVTGGTFHRYDLGTWFRNRRIRQGGDWNDTNPNTNYIENPFNSNQRLTLGTNRGGIFAIAVWERRTAQSTTTTTTIKQVSGEITKQSPTAAQKKEVTFTITTKASFSKSFTIPELKLDVSKKENGEQLKGKTEIRSVVPGKVYTVIIGGRGDKKLKTSDKNTTLLVEDSDDNDYDDLVCRVSGGRFFNPSKNTCSFILDAPPDQSLTTQGSTSTPTPATSAGAKKIFNTVDYITKADRPLWRINPNASPTNGFLDRYGILPFDPNSTEAQVNSFVGTHVIRWEKINFPVDGYYRISVDVDDNVKIYIGNSSGDGRVEIGNGLTDIEKGGDETIIDYKGFSAPSTPKGQYTTTKYFKAGNYRIRAELEQIKGKELAKGNPMALAIDIETSYVETEVVAAKSWQQNPLGVALTIEAPLPPTPQEKPPAQVGRCPSNPFWTTRFPNAKQKWYPVRYNGYSVTTTDTKVDEFKADKEEVTPPSLTEEVELTLYRKNGKDNGGNIFVTFTPKEGEGQIITIDNDIPNGKSTKKKITIYKNTIYEITSGLTEKGKKVNTSVEQGTLELKNDSKGTSGGSAGASQQTSDPTPWVEKAGGKRYKEYNKESSVLFVDALPSANDNDDFVISLPKGKGQFAPSNKTKVSGGDQNRNTWKIEYSFAGSTVSQNQLKKKASTGASQNTAADTTTKKARFVKKNGSYYLDVTGFSGNVEIDLRYLIQDPKKGGNGFAALKFSVPGTSISFNRTNADRTKIIDADVTKKYIVKGGKEYGPIVFSGGAAKSTTTLQDSTTLVSLDPKSAADFNKKKSLNGIERDFDITILGTSPVGVVKEDKKTANTTQTEKTTVTKTTGWSKFTNRYAISPVPPLGSQGSDKAGITFSNTWDIEVPFTGFYGFKATADNEGRLLVDGEEVLKAEHFATDSPKTIKKKIEKGKHTITVEVYNKPQQVSTTQRKKIFSTQDWQAQRPILPAAKETKPTTTTKTTTKSTTTTVPNAVVCHAGGGFGGLKNTPKQTKIGKVIKGKGKDGAPGLAPGNINKTSASGGGAGLRNSAAAASGATLDGAESAITNTVLPSGSFAGEPTRAWCAFGDKRGAVFNFGGNRYIPFNGNAIFEVKNGYGYGGSMHLKGNRETGNNDRFVYPERSAGGAGAVRISFSGKTKDYTKPGTYEFVVPEGITTLDLTCIGGGGSGYSESSLPVGLGGVAQVQYLLDTLKDTGGSGGAYAYDTVTVTPGTRLKVVVGAGGAYVDKGSKNGEDSYVELIGGSKTSTTTTTESVETESPESESLALETSIKKADVTYEGPLLFGYKHAAWSDFMNLNSVSPVIETKEKPLKASASFIKRGNNNDLYLDASGFSGVVEIDLTYKIHDSNAGGGWAALKFEVPGTPIVFDRQLSTGKNIIVQTIKQTYKVDGGKVYGPIKFTGGNEGKGVILESKSTIASFDSGSLKQKANKERDFDIIISDVRGTAGPGKSKTNKASTELIGDKTLIWRNVSFSESGQYLIEMQADNIATLKIGGNEIHKVNKFTGKQIPFFATISKGTYDIEIVLTNSPTAAITQTTNFDENPTGVACIISVDVTSRSISPAAWQDSNPMGVSAVMISPPCPKPTSGRGVVTEIIPTDPGNGYNPPQPGPPTYPVTLELTKIIPTNPGINYNCGVDELVIEPSNGAQATYSCDSFGRITNITVTNPGIGFTFLPRIDIRTSTGVNFEATPVLTPIRDPIGVPEQQLIQVTDLVGLKQTGYIEGRPYYGAVFYENGIKYAGYYKTVGDPVQVYDTLQESIDAQITTPPSAIQRSGTDIRSNDPRLNIPKTPENLTDLNQ